MSESVEVILAAFALAAIVTAILTALFFAGQYLQRHASKNKPVVPPLGDAGIRDLVAEGRIQEAVELYTRFAGVDPYTARDVIAAMEQELRLADEQAKREESGLGLKETKDAVDEIERGLR